MAPVRQAPWAICMAALLGQGARAVALKTAQVNHDVYHGSFTSTQTQVDTMQLVLQYGAESYIPTSSASGTVGEGTAGFAKLSDATINSIDEDDAAYDYFKLTYDPQSMAAYDNREGSEYDSGKMFVRTAQSSFNDVEKNMGWGNSYWFCSPWNANTLSECTDWLAPTTDGSFDTNRVVSEYGGDCRRVFMDNNGDYASCQNPMSTTARCLSGNCVIANNNRWGMRTNFKLYKFGALPQAHATGDPHLQNIHGERFDLMKPGKHVLIHIPRGVTADKALLRVQAVARRLGARCSDLYFQDINVTGKWTNSDLHYSAQVVADETPQWTKFGPVELKVAHGHTEKGVKYLNFYVKHLGRAGAAVGGLLGEDDSAEAATPSAECRKLVSVEKIATRTASELPGASVAIAAM